jgi:signal transduction histidine kinase
MSDADRRSAVQTIADRAGALAKLVEQLLLGSRAGADQLAVTNAPFDLAGLLRGAAVAFRPLSDRHALTTDIPDDLPLAFGDPTATDVIVGQLLENAFKYSPEGGAVIVRAREAGDRIEVLVEDEGIGIPEVDRERVFERFVQGGETGDRRRFGGIGLGLYIVHQLARAQDGEVMASDRAGGGTIMRLHLPRPAQSGELAEGNLADDNLAAADPAAADPAASPPAAGDPAAGDPAAGAPAAGDPAAGAPARSEADSAAPATAASSG